MVVWIGIICKEVDEGWKAFISKDITTKTETGILVKLLHFQRTNYHIFILLLCVFSLAVFIEKEDKNFTFPNKKKIKKLQKKITM